jgi:DNA polymerase IV
MITCVLLPYFAATLVRRERGIPNSVPLILRSGERVIASCECATARGVAFGMTTRQAMWLIPEAQMASINPQHIRRAAQEVIQVLSQFTHLIEAENVAYSPKAKMAPYRDGRQSAVFSVDLERLVWEDATQLAQAMGVTVRQTTAFESACGLAATKFPAYAAAVGVPSGHLRVVASGEEAAFLASLPITLLPMNAETQRRLLLLGIDTIGALAELPLSAVLAQCGKEGALLHQLARGLDSRRVIPTTPQVVERVTRVFELPLTDERTIVAILSAMATELSARLKASGSMGKTLLLQLMFDGGESAQTKTTLRTFAASSRFLQETLLRLLARIDVPSGVCSMVVTLTDLVPFSGQQLELFPEQPKPRERLQQRLSSILAQPDAPECFWITPNDPAARRIEHRYQFERVTPL